MRERTKSSPKHLSLHLRKNNKIEGSKSESKSKTYSRKKLRMESFDLEIRNIF